MEDGVGGRATSPAALPLLSPPRLCCCYVVRCCGRRHTLQIHFQKLCIFLLNNCFVVITAPHLPFINAPTSFFHREVLFNAPGKTKIFFWPTSSPDPTLQSAAEDLVPFALRSKDAEETTSEEKEDKSAKR